MKWTLFSSSLHFISNYLPNSHPLSSHSTTAHAKYCTSEKWILSILFQSFPKCKVLVAGQINSFRYAEPHIEGLVQERRNSNMQSFTAIKPSQLGIRLQYIPKIMHIVHALLCLIFTHIRPVLSLTQGQSHQWSNPTEYGYWSINHNKTKQNTNHAHILWDIS